MALKNYQGILGTLLFGFIAIQAIAAKNLIQNGDFETTDTHGKPTVWNGGGLTLLRGQSFSNHGHAGLVTHRADWWAGLEQDIGQGETLAGKRFHVSAWVKLHGAPIGIKYTLEVVMRFMECGKLQYVEAGAVHANGDTWAQIKENFQFSPRAKGTVRFYLRGRPDEERDFDFLADNIELADWTEPLHWRQEANQRIEHIRKRNVNMRIHGMPNGATNIEVEQIRLRFGMGSMTNEHIITNPTFRQHFMDNFEYAVMEDQMKWYDTEAKKDQVSYTVPDAIMEILEDGNITVRGHNIFWADPTKQPSWVPSLSVTELKEYMEKRVRSVVSHYRDRVIHWDVNNEMLHFDFYRDHLKDQNIPTWMFQETRKYDPKVMLFLNDYATLTDGHLIKDYKKQATDLLEHGAEIQGLGVQGHFWRHEPPDTSLILERFNELSTLSLPIWVTELDVVDADEDARADKLEAVIRTAFSHEGVGGVVLWGFWAGDLWAGPHAALWNQDWTLTAAGRRWQAMRKEWKSHAEWSTPTTDENYAFRGFHGKYKLRITHNGTVQEEIFDVIPGNDTQNVVIDFTAISENASRKYGSASYRFEGCYGDYWDRTLTGYHFSDDHGMTVDLCTEACRVTGYYYAGMESASECYCGNTIDIHGTDHKYGKKDNHDCVQPCVGNSTQICGGGWRVSIYMVSSDDQVNHSSYVGCYGDGSSRALDGHHISDPTSMTTSRCIHECSTRGFAFAGLEYKLECHCGNEYDKYGTREEKWCTQSCSGNSHESCGGGWTISVYSTANNIIGKRTVPVADTDTAISYIGCYNDREPKVMGRPYVAFQGLMRVSQCADRCLGFNTFYMGLGNGKECYCGFTYGKYGHSDDNACDIPCTANVTEMCGGKDTITVYDLGTAQLNMIGKRLGKQLITTKRDGQATRKDAAIKYIGCYNDREPNVMGRPYVAFQGLMSVGQCADRCLDFNTFYMGLGNGKQCYCGYTYGKYGRRDDNACDIPCTANVTEICGGKDTITVYDLGTAQLSMIGKRLESQQSIAVTEDQTTRKGTYLGCFQDARERAMKGEMIHLDSTTTEKCIDACSKKGYAFAGTQWASECHCSNCYSIYGQRPSHYCSIPCAGNSNEICGGSYSLSVYSTGHAPTDHN